MIEAFGVNMMQFSSMLIFLSFVQTSRFRGRDEIHRMLSIQLSTRLHQDAC